MIKEEKTKNENPNFKLKAVADFLDGNHHFYIPSYQRGYRWDKKEVEDLLKDIGDFAENAQKGDFYCLQPVVVKSKQWKDEKKETVIGWEVIDGQQRLTTLWLLLEYLKHGSRTPFVIKSILHDINYETREKLDLSNPDKNQNIDEFYVFQARNVIKTWFEDREGKVDVDYSAFEKVLFNNNQEIPQVKFIWYVVENNDDLNSIKVFNNLNKGKIRLTNAELIKALFVLKTSKKDEIVKDNYATEELILEWNLIENALHDDTFWRFLTNSDYNPATRIDLIFDFLTKKSDKDDDDFSYRNFQNLYDGIEEECWKGMKVNLFLDAWKQVKIVYQLFLFWFENRELYHYVGYLLTIGCSHKEIYDKIAECPKKKMVEEIRGIINAKVGISAENIAQLSYSSQLNKNKIRQILLLFNIESCVKTDTYRFPFDLYKKESWDIEHIASQTTNNLQKTSDKIGWLKYAEAIICENPEWPELQKEALDLAKTMEETQEDKGSKFDVIYPQIVNMVESERKNKEGEQEDEPFKDTIGNLTLLDAGTNRSYGNALFQTKRQKILEKDKNGAFIPPCTKNIFLKYYTSNNDKNSQWKNSWMSTDADSYKEELIKILNDFLN
jgi:hypothetical protein